MTQETSNLVKVWNHTIRIKAIGEEKTKYTDKVEIHAGFRTFLVWGFANIFYSYRQRRWKKIIKGLIGERIN